jgi:hypothetical protein
MSSVGALTALASLADTSSKHGQTMERHKTGLGHWDLEDELSTDENNEQRQIQVAKIPAAMVHLQNL